MSQQPHIKCAYTRDIDAHLCQIIKFLCLNLWSGGLSIDIDQLWHRARDGQSLIAQALQY